MKLPLFFSAILWLLILNQCFAQNIIAGKVSANDSYTDINPDSVFQWTLSSGQVLSDSLEIDMNNDGTPDFNLHFSVGFGFGYLIEFDAVPKNHNQVAVAPDTVYNSASVFYCGVGDCCINVDSIVSFKENDTISSAERWDTSQGFTYYYSVEVYPKHCDLYIMNNWNNLGDRYVGVRVLAGKDTLYGWIRCTVIADANHAIASVLDYACNKSVVTGIKNTSASSFHISPNPVKQWLNIVYNTNDDAVFELYNQVGLQVALISLSANFKNRMVDVKDLPDGIYNYRITQQSAPVQSGTVAVIK